jgi:hypothetical protein
VVSKLLLILLNVVLIQLVLNTVTSSSTHSHACVITIIILHLLRHSLDEITSFNAAEI